MTGPGNELPERAADGGHFRASQADRELAIDVLKTAFAEERLTKDAFDLRVSQALASRTYAELAAVTSGLRVSPAAARPAAARPAGARPASTPARTLAKAARRSGVCMLIAFVIAGIAALSHKDLAAALALVSAAMAVIAASGFLGYGMIDAWQEHRSRGQLPPRPDRNDEGLTDRNGQGLESGRPGSGDRDRGRPGAHPRQTLFDRCTGRPSACVLSLSNP